MRLSDWLALAAFWTILVHGNTENGIPQNNAYGIVPTRHYNTTIPENTSTLSGPLNSLSFLDAPASATVDALTTIASENDISKSDSLQDQKEPHVVEKLQVEVGDADETGKAINSKINESKFLKGSIENEKSSNDLASPNHSKFDGNPSTNVERIDRKIFGVSKMERQFKFSSTHPFTPVNKLSILSTSVQYFQLSKKRPSPQLGPEINEHHADSSLAGTTEVLDYKGRIITEKENTGVIKQRNNVQSSTLQMVGTISSGQNHISESFNWNEMKHADDVNILGEVEAKSPEHFHKSIQPEDERLPVKSWMEKLTDAHLQVVNSDANAPASLYRPRRIDYSAFNKNDIQRVQSTDNTPIEQTPQRMSNDPKFQPPLSTTTTEMAQINDPHAPRIPILQHHVTTKTIKKSIIQSTPRSAIKHGRKSKCHHAYTTVITRPLRDTMKKLISCANTSGNHELSMTSPAESTELPSSEFYPPDIKNELNSRPPPTSPSKWLQSTGTSHAFVSVQTRNIDSALPSAVTLKIDKPKYLESYIIKSKPDPFVTSVSSNLRGAPLWNYDRYAVKTSKVAIGADSTNADRLMNDAQLLRIQVSQTGLDEIAVETSQLHVIRPTTPKVFHHLVKPMRSIRSHDLTAQSDAIDLTSIAPSTISMENNPIDSRYDDRARDMEFFNALNATTIVTHADTITNQPNTSFTEATDRMSWQTTENASTPIYSDIRTVDHSEPENSTHVSPNQWPVKHSAVVEGDLVLGGLMMIHEREDTITCGPVMPQGGVQALEAMLYTLDWLNKREIVPGVKIGAHILDDCDKDTYGLEMAVDFIKGELLFMLSFLWLLEL